MQIPAHVTTNNGSLVQKRPFYRHLWVATLTGSAGDKQKTSKAGRFWPPLRPLDSAGLAS